MPCQNGITPTTTYCRFMSECMWFRFTCFNLAFGFVPFEVHTHVDSALEHTLHVRWFGAHSKMDKTIETLIYIKRKRGIFWGISLLRKGQQIAYAERRNDEETYAHMQSDSYTNSISKNNSLKFIIALFCVGLCRCGAHCHRACTLCIVNQSLIRTFE